MTTDHDSAAQGTDAAERPAMWKFFLYSAIGGFMFFVPVTLGGTSSIMLDHIVTWIRDSVPGVLPYYAVRLAGVGT